MTRDSAHGCRVIGMIFGVVAQPFVFMGERDISIPLLLIALVFLSVGLFYNWTSKS